MNKLSQRIKMKADELGFQKVGITKVEFSSENKLNLDQWISKGFHASMQWIENRKEERANIFNYFPDAVSLISVGMNYFSGNTQDDLKSKFKFSNYAWGEDYHSLIKDRLQILLKWIKNTSEEIEGVACVDTSPIMEKSWAQKAGLGWQGKHTNLISRDYGSWLFLGEIMINHLLRIYVVHVRLALMRALLMQLPAISLILINVFHTVRLSTGANLMKMRIILMAGFMVVIFVKKYVLGMKNLVKYHLKNHFSLRLKF